MKRNTLTIFILFSLILSLGCQRDDICPASVDTTPLLIIRFYENQEPFDLQAPQNLSIRSVDSDSTDFVINTGGTTPVPYYRFSRDSIAIPLKTNSDVTEYVFTLNTAEGDTTATHSGIRDTISFTYGREEEYLNRACAYKVNYLGLKVSVASDTDSENWIQDVQIEQGNVEDQNQAHVSIFF